MLAKRIIPCLDVTDGRVVKGVNFTELRDAGDPVEIARRYDEQGADELTFLDITASSDNRGLILDIIESVACQVFIPLTVGGGVREVADVRRLVNAGAVKLTGQKESQKLYRRHSGFEGGLREERAVDVRKRQPVRLVEEAVRGMLPKTKMGDAMYRKLKVYASAEHPHTAQQPRKIEVA